MRTIILELKSKGKTSEDIAKELSVSRDIVDKILLDEYYSKRKIRIPKATFEQILQLRYDNVPFVKASALVKVAPATITRILRGAGITFLNSAYLDKSHITDKAIQNIISDFKNGIPIYKLAIEYKVNKDVMANILKRHGIDTMAPTFNQNCFSEIKDEEQAYWLGFLFADGYIGNKTNDIELSLQALDIAHLFKFKTFLSSKNLPILTTSNKYNRCRIGVSNKTTKHDLIKWGCIPQKSLSLKFPQIPDTLIPAFIRGYFDGDGALSYAYTNPGKSQKIKPNCKILGTCEFLSKMQQYLTSNNIKCYLSKPRNKQIYALSMSTKNSIKFLQIIYTNASIYLNRKYARYKFFLKNNFAVQKSDLLDNDRVISEKAITWININENIKFKRAHANSEITNISKEILVS